MIHQRDVKIAYNLELFPSCYKMGFISSEITKSARPGQFVMVRVGEEYSPLLRRPFSIHRIISKRETVEILYKVVGRGTRMLSEMQGGEYFNLLGPLGNGFWITSDMNRAIMIAGGMGVAPLYFLAENILQKANIDIIMLLGGKTSDDILAVSELEKLRVELKIATEDGSLGYRGMVTGMWQDVLGSIESSSLKTHGFACGPWPMMAQAAELFAKSDIPCQVSLETRMACGIGACLGCAVSIKGSDMDSTAANLCYRRVCKDGPIFDSKEVVW